MLIMHEVQKRAKHKNTHLQRALGLYLLVPRASKLLWLVDLYGYMKRNTSYTLNRRMSNLKKENTI